MPEFKLFSTCSLIAKSCVKQQPKNTGLVSFSPTTVFYLSYLTQFKPSLFTSINRLGLSVFGWLIHINHNPNNKNKVLFNFIIFDVKGYGLIS